ncbi:MAG TPA: hypothetical protein VMH26_14210 [Burkholderiales bacterium]|nr:hypothetical protein [Burkholderiales bacterium]
MSPRPTLIDAMLAFAMGCAVCQVYAQPQTPRSTPAGSSSAAPELPTADFLQPLSRKLEAQLPDLGGSADQQKRAEPQDPRFNTLWVLPKATTGESPARDGVHHPGG